MSKIGNHETHEIADVFPMMNDDEHGSLVRSMRDIGFDESKPVVLYEGKILDGRNRYRAAIEADVRPHFREWTGGNPWNFVRHENADRRHLDPGTRTACVLILVRGSDDWEGQRVASQEAANVARSEAAGARPRNDAGQLVASSGLSRDNGLDEHDWDPNGVAHKAGSYGTSADEPKRTKPRTETNEHVRLAQAAGVSPATAARVLSLEKKAPAQLARLSRGEMKLSDGIREMKREVIRESLEDVAAVEAKASAGVYDVVVLDPPWPMEKIERDERPNQVEFDYPTMSEVELAALHVPCAEDCHVWVWTTHRFLPMALRLLEAWGLKYVCAFVWHKPGGFQPIGLPQYNCEFAIYARRGAPTFLDTKALPLCFEAPRGKHSEKPEAFYDVLRRVTAGRRLDMFNRRAIDGFDGWGKEAAHAAE